MIKTTLLSSGVIKSPQIEFTYKDNQASETFIDIPVFDYVSDALAARAIPEKYKEPKKIIFRGKIYLAGRMIESDGLIISNLTTGDRSYISVNDTRGLYTFDESWRFNPELRKSKSIDGLIVLAETEFNSTPSKSISDSRMFQSRVLTWFKHRDGQDALKAANLKLHYFIDYELWFNDEHVL